MQLIRLITMFLFLFCATSYASSVRPWASASVLWGQGGIGVDYVQSNYTARIYDAFIFDWGEEKITYNELNAEISIEKYTTGLRYRRENKNDEYAPFLGLKTDLYTDKKFNIYTYNEIEYRENPYLFEDYTRFYNYSCLIYQKGIFEDHLLKPYMANAIYFNADDASFEKDRIYVGYLVELEGAFFGAYVIPFRWGEKDGSWDDTRSFGAFVNFTF